MTPSKPLLVISTILALSSCSTSDQPSFRHMSDEELISYNANKPLKENVICFKKQNTGSFIKEIQCRTLAELAAERNNSRPIDTLVNDPRIYSSPNRLSRD